jgi:hypothetical protein
MLNVENKVIVNPFGEFKIQNSKFKIEDPTDKSGGLNNVAGHFFFSMNKFRGLYPFLFRSMTKSQTQTPDYGC